MVLTPCKWKGWGPPATPAGKLISMVELPGKGKTLPEGRRSVASDAPLKIWRRTGTVGGTKVVPLMVNDKLVTFWMGKLKGVSDH